MAIIELRQYTLHPGTRDTLIDLFDAHFLEGQEQYGMTVVGQFRDLDDPNRFVWLRSFPDMESRRTALEGFYRGPVWLAHRDAANATMIAFDDVLLLRPVDGGSRFRVDAAGRPPKASAGHGALAGNGVPADQGLPADWGGPADRGREAIASIAVAIYPLQPGAEAWASQVGDALRLGVERAGGELVAALVTDKSENTFPQLPLREGETMLVLVMRFADPVALAAYTDRLGSGEALPPALARYGGGPPAILRLAPTIRSLLR